MEVQVLSRPPQRGVAQLAERALWEREVARSNRVTPTIAELCNGSTAAFEAVCPGSNPGSAASP